MFDSGELFSPVGPVGADMRAVGTKTDALQVVGKPNREGRRVDEEGVGTALIDGDELVVLALHQSPTGGDGAAAIKIESGTLSDLELRLAGYGGDPAQMRN